jgi:hypothetical protein
MKIEYPFCLFFLFKSQFYFILNVDHLFTYLFIYIIYLIYYLFIYIVLC